MKDGGELAQCCKTSRPRQRAADQANLNSDEAAIAECIG
jgi:hypothetical protein